MGKGHVVNGMSLFHSAAIDCILLFTVIGSYVKWFVEIHGLEATIANAYSRFKFDGLCIKKVIGRVRAVARFSRPHC